MKNSVVKGAFSQTCKVIRNLDIIILTLTRLPMAKRYFVCFFFIHVKREYNKASFFNKNKSNHIILQMLIIISIASLANRTR